MIREIGIIVFKSIKIVKKASTPSQKGLVLFGIK